jgi:hypothetical protein
MMQKQCLNSLFFGQSIHGSFEVFEFGMGWTHSQKSCPIARTAERPHWLRSSFACDFSIACGSPALPRGLGDEELIERLVAVRGVGRWNLEMLLIFTLGRPDVFPSDDCGVRSGWRAAKKLDEMPKAKEFRVLAELWQPHRTLAAWYLWPEVDAAKA